MRGEVAFDIAAGRATNIVVRVPNRAFVTCLTRGLEAIEFPQFANGAEARIPIPIPQIGIPPSRGERRRR